MKLHNTAIPKEELSTLEKYRNLRIAILDHDEVLLVTDERYDYETLFDKYYLYFMNAINSGKLIYKVLYELTEDDFNKCIVEFK